MIINLLSLALYRLIMYKIINTESLLALIRSLSSESNYHYPALPSLRRNGHITGYFTRLNSAKTQQVGYKKKRTTAYI